MTLLWPITFLLSFKTLWSQHLQLWLQTSALERLKVMWFWCFGFGFCYYSQKGIDHKGTKVFLCTVHQTNKFGSIGLHDFIILDTETDNGRRWAFEAMSLRIDVSLLSGEAVQIHVDPAEKLYQVRHRTREDVWWVDGNYVIHRLCWSTLDSLNFSS